MSTALDIEAIRKALDDRRGDWLELSKHAKVSHSWISQFMRGKIPNPGYATLSRLNDELSKAEPAKA